MAQGAQHAPGDPGFPHAEKLDIRQRSAIQLFEQLPRLRPLQLEPERLAGIRIGYRSLVTMDRNVVPSRLCVELHPVGHRRPANDVELVIIQSEENHVSDEVSVGVAGDQLLRLVATEVGEGVHPQIGNQPLCVGAFHVQISHVIGLIHECDTFPPGTLFTLASSRIPQEWGTRRDPSASCASSRLRLPTHRVFPGTTEIAYLAPVCARVGERRSATVGRQARRYLSAEQRQLIEGELQSRPYRLTGGGKPRRRFSLDTRAL